MSDKNPGFEAENMEMLRLVLRACDHSTQLMLKVVLACKRNERSEVSDVLPKIKQLVEMMEGKPISDDELVRRIAQAEPKGGIQF